MNAQKLLISARYWLLGMAEQNPEYYQVLKALEVAVKHHDGVRNGGDPEIIHQLQIFHYLRSMHRYIKNPVMVYTLVFLHDALEDPNQASVKRGRPEFITTEFIRENFGEAVLGKLVKLSKEIMGLSNPEYSLAEIFDDEDTSVVKAADRLNNVMSMHGVFKPERLARYISETRQAFIVLIKSARRKFVAQEPIYENVKLGLEGTLSLIEKLSASSQPSENP